VSTPPPSKYTLPKVLFSWVIPSSQNVILTVTLH
jgi:hypothetical protein